jgi:hypothetical protein
MINKALLTSLSRRERERLSSLEVWNLSFKKGSGKCTLHKG